MWVFKGPVRGIENEQYGLSLPVLVAICLRFLPTGTRLYSESNDVGSRKLRLGR